MIKVSMVAICGVIFTILLKTKNQEYSVIVSLSTCVILMACVISRLETLVQYINRFQAYVVIDKEYIQILLKMAGISYVAEISSSLCKDCGQQTLATQVEMFGKLSVLALGMPVLLSLLDMLERCLSI